MLTNILLSIILILVVYTMRQVSCLRRESKEQLAILERIYQDLRNVEEDLVIKAAHKEGGGMANDKMRLYRSV